MIVAAVVAALVVVAWWMIHIPAVQDAVLRRVIARTFAGTRNDLLEQDSMRVLLCGTGNPLPDRERADACTAIFAGGNFYLVDTGAGAWKNLGAVAYSSGAPRRSDVHPFSFRSHRRARRRQHADVGAGSRPSVARVRAAGRRAGCRRIRAGLRAG